MVYQKTINQNGYITMIFADEAGVQYVINLPTIAAVVEGELTLGPEHIKSIQSGNKYSNPGGRVILTTETLNAVVDAAMAYVKTHPELYAEWESQVNTQ